MPLDRSLLAVRACIDRLEDALYVCVSVYRHVQRRSLIETATFALCDRSLRAVLRHACELCTESKSSPLVLLSPSLKVLAPLLAAFWRRGLYKAVCARARLRDGLLGNFVHTFCAMPMHDRLEHTLSIFDMTYAVAPDGIMERLWEC